MRTPIRLTAFLALALTVLSAGGTPAVAQSAALPDPPTTFAGPGDLRASVQRDASGNVSLIFTSQAARETVNLDLRPDQRDLEINLDFEDLSDRVKVYVYSGGLLHATLLLSPEGRLESRSTVVVPPKTDSALSGYQYSTVATSSIRDTVRADFGNSGRYNPSTRTTVIDAGFGSTSWSDTFNGRRYEPSIRTVGFNASARYLGGSVKWTDRYSGGRYVPSMRAVGISHPFGTTTWTDRFNAGQYAPAARNIEIRHPFGTTTWADQFSGGSYRPQGRTIDLGRSFGHVTYNDVFQSGAYRPLDRTVGFGGISWNDQFSGTRYTPGSRIIEFGPFRWQDKYVNGAYAPESRTITFGPRGYTDVYSAGEYRPVGSSGAGSSWIDTMDAFKPVAKSAVGTLGSYWGKGASTVLRGVADVVDFGSEALGDRLAWSRVRSDIRNQYSTLSQSWDARGLPRQSISKVYGYDFLKGAGFSDREIGVKQFPSYSGMDIRPLAKPGGILLDKAAVFLGDIKDIKGAFYDTSAGSLVLVGKTNLPLPKMNREDVTVAVRAVYDYSEDPGVSIEPIPGRNDIGRVVYYGHTENTRFGSVLFEADRMLKVLGAGIDNITGQPVACNVPGFQTEATRRAALASETLDYDTNWNDREPTVIRYWFHPRKMILARSQDGRSIIFREASVDLSWELVSGPPVKALTVSARRFVDHINARFDDYEKEIPVFAELRQLMKIAGVVKWMKEKSITLDRAELSPDDIEWMATAEVTPMIRNDYVFRSLTRMASCTLIGGVDFKANNEYQADNGEGDQMKDAALAARPRDSAPAWDFQVSGERYRAVAVLPSGASSAP